MQTIAELDFNRYLPFGGILPDIDVLVWPEPDEPEEDAWLDDVLELRCSSL